MMKIEEKPQKYMESICKYILHFSDVNKYFSSYPCFFCSLKFLANTCWNIPAHTRNHQFKKTKLKCIVVNCNRIYLKFRLSLVIIFQDVK